MKALEDIDTLVKAKHMQAETLQHKLYQGHLDLITNLINAHVYLVETNYSTEVRESLVRPAYSAVMASSYALAGLGNVALQQ